MAFSKSIFLAVVLAVAEIRSEKCYDFIVVGGGSGGCRVAEKLSRKQHHDVLVLEAGAMPPDFSEIPLMSRLSYNGYAWSFKVEPMKNACKAQPNQTLVTGRVFGGGSTINLMNYERGDFSDYDRWESEYGAEGWGGDQAFKYLRADEKQWDFKDKSHGHHGDLQVTSSYDTDILFGFFNASQQMGYPVRDTGNGNTTGVYRMQATVGPDGHRSSSFNAFIKKHIGARRNLHLESEAYVTRINFNGTRAVSVTFEKNGVARTVCVRKEVIMSAGAIQTPQILMLSGVGPKEHLDKLNIKTVADVPVGRNLQNHVTVSGVMASVKSPSYLDVPSTRDMDGLTQWYLNGTGPFTSPAGTHLGVGFFSVQNRSSTPDLEIMLQGVANDDVCRGRTNSVVNITFLPILMHPKSRGSIELASTDPHRPPVIHLNYFDEEEDMIALAKGAMFTHEMIKQSSFAKMDITPVLPSIPDCDGLDTNSLDYWKCFVVQNTASMAHPAGSCRMGAADKDDTVVDPRLRVKGIDNVRIADASVFPDMITGHTNAPSIMIGAKAGDMIIEDN